MDKLEELCRQLVSRGVYGRTEGRSEEGPIFLDADYGTSAILSEIEDELEERGIVVRERGHEEEFK